MAKRYYWLKLKEDFFRDKPILKLRKLAGGDTYTIIYLKMMLLSLQTDGKIYFDGVEDTFAEEIALEIGEDVDNVKVTIMYLIQKGLLQEVNEAEIFMTQMPELVGSESESAARMRKKRHRDSVILQQNALLSSQCDEDVTDERHIVQTCDTEKEKDIRVRDKSKETRRIDYQKIVNLYNDTCVSFPRIKSLSEARKKAIKARLNSYTVDQIHEAFKKAEASDFLKGKNGNNWSATFDWIMKDANMAKILDGNYDNTSGRKKASSNIPSGTNQDDLDDIF